LYPDLAIIIPKPLKELDTIIPKPTEELKLVITGKHFFISKYFLLVIIVYVF